MMLHGMIFSLSILKGKEKKWRTFQKKLMIGACEIACRYPSLSLEDAVGDARQLAEMIKQYHFEDTQRRSISLLRHVGLSVRT